jgi:hypothetical protein
LRREISHRPRAHSHLQQRKAILEGLRPHRIQVFGPDGTVSSRITDIQSTPDANVTILVGAIGRATRIVIYVGSSDWLLQRRPQRRFHTPVSTKTWIDFNQTSALECTTLGSTTFAVLYDTAGYWSINAIECAEVEENRENGTLVPTGDARDQQRLRVLHGPSQTYSHHALWDVKFQPGVSEPSWALAGSQHVSFFDTGVHGTHSRLAVAKSAKVSLPLADEMEATALTWLDIRTLGIAMVPFPRDPWPHAPGDQAPPAGSGQSGGRRKKHRPPIDQHLRSEVRLWDIRSRDSSSRILPSSRLTGLSSVPLPSTSPSASTTASPNPHYILTASTSAISMHDLRFTPEDPTAGTTRPLWTAAHTSQTPRLPLAVHAGLDVVAAVDREGIVQCYSLANGLRARSLCCDVEDRKYNWSDACLGIPRWQEDGRGAPYLCVGGREGWVYSWKW